ncbi:hypothetical protein D915_004842 [Fasciola hepatica]|uniref:Uncharacterized protein n=1 Tax=Fasciola hepatica TaxID=6192 RepID=A0A4E0RZ75_FASHE|nr:hypothetical protein D915_004842 [Fasciola hepatica]
MEAVRMRMQETSRALCSPIPVLTNNSKPMPTRYSATPILIVPNWRTTLTTQPVPCVQRLTKLTAQSPARSGIPSHFQQFRGVPSIRVNFLPAFVSRTNRYTKIYNVRQSLSHLSPRRNISSPITIWTRGPSPPPSIPEEDEYECDDDNQTKEDCTRKITHSPILVNPNTTLLPTARKFPSNGANHTQNVDSSSGPQAPSTPNGVYWPDAPLTSMETGLYEHRLGILTAQDQLSANDSIRVGLYKTKENYDPYWFGSGSDLLLLQSLSRTGIGSAPVDYMDSYDVYYDNPPVVMYSNVHIPVSAPNSSQSSITDTETCALRVVNKTTTLSSGTTGYDRHETNGNIATRDDANNGELKDCLLSSTAVTDVPRSTTSGQVPRSASPTASLTPTQGQLGFVDTPRGNSVIVHHPTSPFARVPRGTILPQVTPCSAAAATPVPTSTGPNQSTESRPNINLTSLVRLSPGQASCADVGNSRAPINTTPSVPISGTSGSTIWKKSAPSGGPTVDGNSTGPRVRANNADTQPTYEEAWDLKMARQLGFGISRLTPVHVPVTIPGVLSSNLGPESRLAPVASTKVVTTGPTVSGSSSSSSSSSVRAHGERHQRSGLKFHENRLFDQHPTKSKNDASCAQTGTAATEYDYAYNGSWSMGVKLNLCLAMNGASETGDGSTGPTVASNPTVLPYRPAVPVGNTNKTDSVHVCGPPPQVPAHQTQSSHMNGFAVGSASQGAEIVSTGSRSKRGDPSALNIMTGSVLPSAEVDSTSTDSYDDSWEARHGRVVSELTSARFVDPSSLLLNESTSACPVLSTGQPLSVHVGADALSHVVHHTEPSNRTSSSPSASVSHSQITPTGTGGVSPSVNSTLELLPLEEQP